MSPIHYSTFHGCLFGTAVGDALGLPTEGLSRERIANRPGPLGHRLCFGHGMFSDDTEHTLMVAAALLKHPTDAIAFQKSLAGRLRWWLAALPAGVGLSTGKAILRLWVGFPAGKAGVCSAGNGAAMRSAIIGCFFAKDATNRRTFTRAACVLTHTDQRAIESAHLIAEAAAMACQGLPTESLLAKLQLEVISSEMQVRFPILEECLAQQASVSALAEAIGCKNAVTGFAPDTVSVALYAWLRHRGDFSTTLSTVIACGGDTDTVAAIAGALSGVEIAVMEETSINSIPQEWLERLADWPRSRTYIEKMATALNLRMEPPKLFWPAIPIRNALFFGIVLAHGLRRLLPF